jgi:hypothetical protein
MKQPGTAQGSLENKRKVAAEGEFIFLGAKCCIPGPKSYLGPVYLYIH